MPLLRISLLGKPEIHHGGQPVSFRTRKALALLIYLAVEGGAHSRAKIAALLWPESETGAARATLRSTLRYLRQGLEHEADEEAAPHLNVSRNELSFNFDSEYVLDLDRVARASDSGDRGASADPDILQRAVEAHRGYFLEGFSLPDAPGFEDWSSLQRQHWRLGMSAIYERLSELWAQSGQTLAALETAARWLAHDPLSEAAHRQMMRLHLSNGDRTAALQAYETCRQTLAEELGVQPAAETRALAERIRAGAQAEMADLGPARDAPAEDDRPFPFVGRADPYTRLVEAFYRVEEDGFQVAIVEGEAGIGKTRLVREFLDWARAQGVSVLHGRAFETGGRLPYQAVVEALRPLTSDLPAALSPTWLRELARILPELDEHAPELPDPAGDESVGRTRLFEAVSRAVDAVSADGPLVFFVDDLHWADTATLDLLTYALRRWRAGGTPVLWIGAVRTEALHRAASFDELQDWLRGLERETGFTRLHLERLAGNEVLEFAAQLGLHETENLALDEFSGWLYRETHGQPFYLIETVKALFEDEILLVQREADGTTRVTMAPRVAAAVSWRSPDPLKGFVPPGVRDVVRNRLARLTTPAFELLVASAVLGQDFDFEAVCRVADLERGSALEILDRLLGMRLWVETSSARYPYAFSHDKIRDVAYTEAGDARRQLFHQRALELLKERKAPAAQLAHHAYGAGDYGASFRDSLQAGEDAMQVFAVREALMHFERARRVLVENPRIGERVEAGQRRQLYVRLGRAYELVNDWEAARFVYAEMLEEARAASRPEAEVNALNRMATVEIISSANVEAAKPLLEEARSVAEAHGDTRGLAEAEANLCLSEFYDFERSAALEHGERAIELARETGERELIARCLNAAGYAASGVNLWDRVERYGEEAHRLYADLGNRALEVDSLMLVMFARINTGDTASGVAEARKALAISQEIDNLWGEANCRNHLAAGLLDLGEYGEAYRVIQGAVALEGLETMPQYMAAHTVRGMVYRTLQDFEKALADHLHAEEHFGQMDNPQLTWVLAPHFCADYVALGNWDQAYEHAKVAMRTKDFAWYYTGFVYWTVIEALLHGGDQQKAEEDITELEEAVGHVPRYRIVVERSRASIFRWKGMREEAVVRLEKALRAAEELALPGEQWPILAELAELYREAGREGKAEEARGKAASVVRSLADTIEDADLRKSFVSARRVRGLLEAWV